MTRDRIIELLDLVVLELANQVPPPASTQPVSPDGPFEPGQVYHVEPTVLPEEWAYVKGLAAGALLQFRGRLRGTE